MVQTQALTIDFTSAGNFSAFKSYGWGVPEPHGTWTDGNEAGIEIAGLDPACNYVCELLVSPYLARSDILQQEIIIKISGTEIHSEKVAGVSLIHLLIPSLAIQNDGRLEMTFWCPTPIRPRSLGISADARLLGFSFRRAILTPTSSDHRVVQTRSLAASACPPQTGENVSQSPVDRPSGKQRLAAVTMVYNEPEYLAIWLRHYGHHVGLENCFVVDHGSDDGSTKGLSGCNVVRVPRSTYDPHVQLTFNSKFCSSLLSWYDWVIYSDVDEILLPDPDVAPTLREYCGLSIPGVVTAIGLNVQHVPDIEGTIDLSRPITLQRSWAFASSSMCKPLLISRDIRWPGGSHSSDAILEFHHLYMFHLRWFDFESSVRRLKKSREMAWAQDYDGVHARIADEAWAKQFRSFAGMPREEPAVFGPSSAPLKKFLDEVRASTVGREFAEYKIDLGIRGDRLWRLPRRFVGAF